jgi:hypothetical protein
MIVLGADNLDAEGRSRLAAAIARVRAAEARMGMGCAPVIVMMAAGDSIEQKRAAWRARNERRKNRNKNSPDRSRRCSARCIYRSNAGARRLREASGTRA